MRDQTPDAKGTVTVRGHGRRVSRRHRRLHRTGRQALMLHRRGSDPDGLIDPETSEQIGACGLSRSQTAMAYAYNICALLPAREA